MIGRESRGHCGPKPIVVVAITSSGLVTGDNALWGQRQRQHTQRVGLRSPTEHLSPTKRLSPTERLSPTVSDGR